MMTTQVKRRLRPAAFVLTLLAIELLDELIFGLREAAWPLIRDDLNLSYVQIGLILSIPTLIASLIEPVLGILGDVWKRRILILGGGILFALALLLVGISQSFIALLAANILFYPSSGAFVGLSQAALMDHDPTRHEHNMARWALAGSLGQVIGPLLLGVSVALGVGWRGGHGLFAVLALVLVTAAWRHPFVTPAQANGEATSFKASLISALKALRRLDLLRWLTLLEFSNLMLDVLLGYLALYMVDVAQVSQAEAGIAVAVWTGVGLIGDVLLIPLLERVHGLSYLRVSALVELVLFSAFLLTPDLVWKLVILGLLGFFNSGWYAILDAQVYSAMPGQSGAVMTIHNLFSLVSTVIPLSIGLAAEHFGLGAAMWLLLLGPIALLIGIPRQTQRQKTP